MKEEKFFKAFFQFQSLNLCWKAMDKRFWNDLSILTCVDLNLKRISRCRKPIHNMFIYLLFFNLFKMLKIPRKQIIKLHFIKTINIVRKV